MFEAVARTLSFSRAAIDLGVTQAAVSRQIKRLEDQLQVDLIVRSGGSNRLTDAGELLFGSVYRALEDIEATVAEIAGSADRQILNVSVAPYFSSQWLTPRLMRFTMRHPEIDVRLHHSYHPADHRRERIDIGVNWGQGGWPGVDKIKLVDGSLTPIISPTLLARLGAETLSPERIAAHRLFYEFDIAHWFEWFRQEGVAPRRLDAQRLSDSHALRRAVLDGHGIGLFFSSLIGEDTEGASLVRLSEKSVHTGYDYYLNYSSDIELPHKAKLFKRFVLEEAGI
ncbi:MAG: LysR family transcriptional regulator [Mesorhizobium sp.]|nr:LysR substrate-binding domain-containing protein [Mesorhizobium sp.]RWM30717.1 MAG: LysR family transcriptional regulator [Mesorhizobium sp.]RWM41977.1 MAG: LysR family transcriptional regulator [Mesorhizobium sp.]